MKKTDRRVLAVVGEGKLKRGRAISVAEVAGTFSVHKNTARRWLNECVRRGYMEVELVKHRSNADKHLYHLTAKAYNGLDHRMVMKVNAEEYGNAWS